MPYSGKFRRVVLVGTDVSEQSIASIFSVKTINELKTQLKNGIVTCLTEGRRY
jgi:hypothetical protein